MDHSPSFISEKQNSDPLFRRVIAHAEASFGDCLETPPSEILPALKSFLESEEKMVQRYHAKGDSGKRVCLARSIIFDVLIHTLLRRAHKRWGLEGVADKKKSKAFPIKICVLAVGGYGRQELSPLSDIDILILLKKNPKDSQEKKFLEFLTGEILYPLWDLKLHVGHATRTLKECLIEARAEPQSFNALIEARPISGDTSLGRKFEKRFESFIHNWNSTTYIKTHNDIQEQRRQKYGPTLYMQEPDIKNGIGGLRDFQYVLWMARVKYKIRSVDGLKDRKFLTDSEKRVFLRAYDFLLRVRNQLHFMSRRPTDLLDLEKQPVVAKDLGYGQEDIVLRVEAFMKDYYASARVIQQTSIYLAESFSFFELPDLQPVSFSEVLKSRRYAPRREIDGFIFQEGVYYESHELIFEEDPERLIRFFRHIQQLEGKPSHQLRRLIERSQHLISKHVIESETACRSFRSILQSVGQVYPSLSLMHELGILGKFVPEFAPLTCLVQHEYYHRYTADVHILSTIYELDKIFTENDPLHNDYRECLRKTEIPGLLYLILLLHDIGKAEGIKNHHITGVPIAAGILERLAIPERLRDRILFVVQNHLEMARFWQRYDVDDPQTIESFSQLVKNSENLRLLFVHTYCDTKATAQSLWNDYKETLHRRLFKQTLEIFSEEDSELTEILKEVEMLQDNIIEELEGSIAEEEIQAHFNLLPERYFIHNKQEEIVLHINMIHDLLTRIQEADSVGSLIPIVDWQDNLDQGFSVVTVVTWDRSGLFYKLAGAFSTAGLNILSTKAISRGDHITIDTFYVTETIGTSVKDKQIRDVFMTNLESALVHDTDLYPEIVKRARTQEMQKLSQGHGRLQATYPPNVSVYHELSLKRTIIEVQANDQIGLLYRLAKAIFEHGFDIHFARISTENGVAMDTFYIENLNNVSESTNDNLLELRDSLNDIITQKNLSAA